MIFDLRFNKNTPGFYKSILFFLIPVSVFSQSFERKSGESKEDFAKRIMPAGAKSEAPVVEHKFNSSGNKIVFFFKIPGKDTSINKTDSIQCIDAGILILENEISKKYALQTLRVDCNSDYNCAIENASVQRNRIDKRYELNISFVQVNRASTRLLLKSYKTFLLKQEESSGTFIIDEVKE